MTTFVFLKILQSDNKCFDEDEIRENFTLDVAFSKVPTQSFVTFLFWSLSDFDKILFKD